MRSDKNEFKIIYKKESTIYEFLKKTKLILYGNEARLLINNKSKLQILYQL